MEAIDYYHIIFVLFLPLNTIAQIHTDENPLSDFLYPHYVAMHTSVIYLQLFIKVCFDIFLTFSCELINTDTGVHLDARTGGNYLQGLPPDGRLRGCIQTVGQRPSVRPLWTPREYYPHAGSDRRQVRRLWPSSE